MDTLPVVHLSPFAPGIEFKDLSTLKSTCCAWAIQNVFEFNTDRPSKTRYEITCKAEGGSWRLYARSISGSKAFRISTFENNHTCIGLTHSGHKQTTAKFISGQILPKSSTTTSLSSFPSC